MSALDHFRLLRADARTEIHDLTLDSRAAGEGSLFLALHGAREDGADYAKEAAARGAVCVVTEHAAEGVPCVLVPDAHEAAAKLAARWYGEPAGRMTVVGVTGTNGKTTTTYLLKQLLERCLGAKVGLIGTNQNMIGDAVLPAERTTPDALTLQRLLREMADAGCTHVVMEVSSHALVQRRAGAIDFALGVFTNLTQDHLDYHGTMEAYCDAKARLFRQCRAAAVNGDDPWTPRLLENVTCPVTRFGQGLANDLVGWDAHYCADRVSFTACSDSEHIPVTLHIPGAFSLYNALAALAAALERTGSLLDKSVCAVLPDAETVCGTASAGADAAIWFFAPGLEEKDAEVFRDAVLAALRSAAGGGFSDPAVETLSAAQRLEELTFPERDDLGAALCEGFAAAWAQGDASGYPAQLRERWSAAAYLADGSCAEAVREELLTSTLTALVTVTPGPLREPEPTPEAAPAPTEAPAEEPTE